jgi:hypothetical protein
MTIPSRATTIGDTRGYATLPHDPQIGQNVSGELRHGVRRATVCERREKNELVRKVPVDGGTRAKVLQKRARDVFTNRF